MMLSPRRMAITVAAVCCQKRRSPIVFPITGEAEGTFTSKL
jgi:hypothetical protein